MRFLRSLLTTTLLLTVMGLTAGQADAGIPVIDGANLTQNIVTALQTTASYMNAVQQYATQLRQYQTQLENMVEPELQVWQDMNGMNSQFQYTMQDLNSTFAQIGDPQQYANYFQTAVQMQSSPCYAGGQCAPADLSGIVKNMIAASGNTTTTLQNNLKDARKQATGVNNDAASLSTIQTSVQQSSGNEADLKNIAQLLALQNEQTLAMRTMMINDQAARAQMGLMTEQENAAALTAEKERQAETLANPVKTLGPYTTNTATGLAN